MKTNIPNQIFKQSEHIIAVYNRLSFSLKSILPFIAFMLYSTTISSQSIPSDSYIQNLKASGQNASATELEHLLYDLQSAVYFFSGEIKTYGEKPTSFFTEINSISTIGSSATLKNDIEIVTIEINSISDLSKTIDLSQFSGFIKLKYIYILSNIQTNEMNINKLIQNPNPQYTIIYKISIGG
jgi:hypothetical protein